MSTHKDTKLPFSSVRKSILEKIRKRSTSQSTTGSKSSKGSLNRSTSTSSKKSRASYATKNRSVDSLGDTTYNTQVDSGYNSDASYNDSDTSSTYSRLQRTGSMTFIEPTTTKYDSTNASIVDSKLSEWMKNSNILSSPWQGFNPEILNVPKYLKTNRHNKGSPQILKRVYLAQELNDDPTDEDDIDASDFTWSGSSAEDAKTKDAEEILGTGKKDDVSAFTRELFVMQFSKDGKYLAVAGRSAVIKVYKVISSPLGRMEFNSFEEDHKRVKKPTKAEDKVYPYTPVFHQKPVRVFKGHKSSVLSIDWSKNNFLISGSMDKTVKLWNVDRPDYLASFQHEDFVTTVKFHPTDDRFFLSGSLDNYARIWSILERSIAYGRHLGDETLITAAAFTPDGLYCAFGGFNGSLLLLETKGLHVLKKYDTKPVTIVPHLNRSGNKVTNIKVLPVEENEDNGGGGSVTSKWRFLITTNDSKVRLPGTNVSTHFRGATNTTSIEASVSEDSKYILCGSEDHWCYVWENNHNIVSNKVKAAMKNLVTEKANDLHQKTGFLHKNRLLKKLNFDQVLQENNMRLAPNENNSYAAFHAHHSSVNAAIFAPNLTKKLLDLSDDPIFDLIKRGRSCSSADHFNKVHIPTEEDIDEGIKGFIIVTTDETGLIRVFREDPVYQLRKLMLGIFKKRDKEELKSIEFSLIDNKGTPSHLQPSRISRKSLKKQRDSLSLSPTPSVLSVPTRTDAPSLLKNLTSASTPTTGATANPTGRPVSKSISNGILHSQDGTFQVQTNIVRPHVNQDLSPSYSNENVPYQPPSGAITPEHEIQTPFPHIEVTQHKSSIPLIINTNTSKEKEVVQFETPIGVSGLQFPK